MAADRDRISVSRPVSLVYYFCAHFRQPGVATHHSRFSLLSSPLVPFQTVDALLVYHSIGQEEEEEMMVGKRRMNLPYPLYNLHLFYLTVSCLGLSGRTPSQ